jgi:hypothetical protein
MLLIDENLPIIDIAAVITSIFILDRAAGVVMIAVTRFHAIPFQVVFTGIRIMNVAI